MEVVISAEDIPAFVREAALAESPGLVITEAIHRESEQLYLVIGTVDGVRTEIEVPVGE